MSARFIIMCHRSGASQFGAHSAPLKQDGELVPPLAKLYAQAIADALNASAPMACHYTLESAGVSP